MPVASVALKTVSLPEFGEPMVMPLIPRATYEARIEALVARGAKAGLDAFVVYGDREHAKFADNPILVQLLGDRLRTPAALRSNEPNSAEFDNIGQGIGKAVGSVAEVVITTPFKVLTIATGGE